MYILYHRTMICSQEPLRQLKSAATDMRRQSAVRFRLGLYGGTARTSRGRDKYLPHSARSWRQARRAWTRAATCKPAVERADWLILRATPTSVRSFPAIPCIMHSFWGKELCTLYAERKVGEGQSEGEGVFSRSQLPDFFVSL